MGKLNSYNVTLELDQRTDHEANAAAVIAAYDDMSAAVSTSPHGWLEVTVTIEAQSIGHAVALAQFHAPMGIVTISAMATREFDRRVDEEPTDVIPPLFTTEEAAEVIGVSRQAVNQFIDAGQLPAVRYGARSWALSQGVVRRFAEARAAKSAAR